MRQLHAEFVLLVCHVLGSAARFRIAEASERIVYLGENFFSYVTEEGALKLRYDKAEEKCQKAGAQIWNLNDGSPLGGEKRRANQERTRAVLVALRNIDEVQKQIMHDEILTKTNVVFARSENGSCKRYVIGPFGVDSYTFTHYFRCDLQHDHCWFICEIPHGSSSSSSQTPVTVTEGSTEIATTRVPGEDAVIETIKTIISNAKNTPSLIRDVSESIQNLSEPTEGLKVFQAALFERIDDFINNDAGKAANATDDLFRKTVPALLRKIQHKAQYSTVMRFIKNITANVALHTEVGTNLTNAEDAQSSVLYRLQTSHGSRTLNSSIKSSTVQISFLNGEPQSPVVVTHLEIRSRAVQEQMLSTMVNRIRKQSSSDMVEVLFRSQNATEEFSGMEVNLFFRPHSAIVERVKRAKFHQCVFFNLTTQALESFGCNFVSFTNDGEVHCRCNHTTSFGCVFLPGDFDEGLRMALDIFAFALDIVSLPSLLLCILIFGLVRQIRSPLTVIHLQLCICLFVFEVILAVQNVGLWLQREWPCDQVSGAVFHYLCLTIIAWMTLEGIYILQLMLMVFKRPKSQTRYYLAVGYGIPLIFPLIALAFGTRYESSNQLCFLNNKKPEFWTFLAPLMFMLIVNLAAITAVMYRLRTVNRQVRNVKSELLRYFRGSLSMTALLGFQWALGLGAFYIGSENTAKFVCLLLFVLFTQAQGPLIFVLHIMMVEDTRYAIARSISKRGRFCRCIANFVRPSPPKMDTPSQKGSPTRVTYLPSTSHSSATALTPRELSFFAPDPLG